MDFASLWYCTICKTNFGLPRFRGGLLRLGFRLQGILVSSA